MTRCHHMLMLDWFENIFLTIRFGYRKSHVTRVISLFLYGTYNIRIIILKLRNHILINQSFPIILIFDIFYLYKKQLHFYFCMSNINDTISISVCAELFFRNRSNYSYANLIMKFDWSYRWVCTRDDSCRKICEEILPRRYVCCLLEKKISIISAKAHVRLDYLSDVVIRPLCRNILYAKALCTISLRPCSPLFASRILSSMIPMLIHARATV